MLLVFEKGINVELICCTLTCQNEQKRNIKKNQDKIIKDTSFFMYLDKKYFALKCNVTKLMFEWDEISILTFNFIKNCGDNNYIF